MYCILGVYCAIKEEIPRFGRETLERVSGVLLLAN
jgi:hypothetical protein